MQTDIFNLPDMFVDGVLPGAHIEFYSAAKSSLKNKVNFTQNAIIFMLHGVKQVITPQCIATVDNNSFVMLATGSVLMSEKLNVDNQYSSIILFFSNDFLLQFCVDNNIHKLNKKAGRDLFLFNKDEFILNYQTSLSLLQGINNAGFLKIKLHELLLYLYSTNAELFINFIDEALKESRFNKMKEVVLANIDKGLSIPELAFLSNMSVSSFKRHFAITFNATPQKYFIEAKMQKARKLLLSNKSSSEIYSGLGYENLSSFSKEFKKYYGVSPANIKNI